MNIYLSPSNQNRNLYAYGDTNEAVVCQAIARACQKWLEQAGVAVMVAEENQDMAARCAASDRFGAVLHVPIHTNAFNGQVTGTRLFCYDVKGAGYKACQAVFAALAPITPGTSENIQANPSLYEVRKPKATTVYVEAEFHDVPSAAKWIIENTEEIGRAIAEGICDYLKVELPAPAEEVLYRIQVGAFRDRENAENLLQQLKAGGYRDAFLTR